MLTSSSFLVIAIAALQSNMAFGDTIRSSTQRLQDTDSTTVQATSIYDLLPNYRKYFAALIKSPLEARNLKDEDEDEDEGEDEDSDPATEALAAFTTTLMMSMSSTAIPSNVPSDQPSGAPSAAPGLPEPTSTSPMSHIVSPAPVIPPLTPSTAPPVVPSTGVPVVPPVVLPTNAPVVPPVVLPTNAPVAPPVVLPTAPTVSCPGLTESDRVTQILAILDAVANPNDIRNNATPEGLATTWLIEQDVLHICPANPISCQLIQRWTLAVMYFSTGGDAWYKCSANPTATDVCGSQVPFVNKTRFLSGDTECRWAGISCFDGCVNQILFEQNNLVGTIPTEVGLLSHLAVWGMEQGNLTSTIPTEIGRLTNLLYMDFDFNMLTGSFPSELYSLSLLQQLDVNDNKLTGSIDNMGAFPHMTFLQLHANLFTGTVPAAVGNYVNMTAFTLHKSHISGTMPTSVCDLLVTANKGGVLAYLIADCRGPNPTIVCTCCTDCRTPLP